ncbi:MAG: type II CAAX prenyl endopeptidase Rce1 family protein [Turicibacter sanguinis]
MGFALGYAYYKNQNIWYSIGVHLFQNLFSTIILISSMQ